MPQSSDPNLQRIFADSTVRAWLTSPSEEDLMLTAYNVKLSLITGISVPRTDINIETMYTPLAKCGKWIVGTAYCAGTPNWSCKIVDSIVKLGNGQRDYDRVSRFALNLENGMEWYTITWLKDKRSIVCEKHVGPNGICGNRVYYCDVAEPGEPPTRILSHGAYEYDCYFCTARARPCTCPTAFRYRCFQAEESKNASWGDFLQRQGALGERESPLSGKVWRYDGQSYFDGWFSTIAKQRKFSAESEKLLLQERYLHELGFFDRPVEIGPFLDALQVTGLIGSTVPGATNTTPALQANESRTNSGGSSQHASHSKTDDSGETSNSGPRQKATHKCRICLTVFKQKIHLETHVRSVHERQRPFKCDRCDQDFATVGNLRRHQRNVHEKIRRYACQQCAAQFGERSDLVRHQNKVHGAASSSSPRSR
eukprot:CAMPEP_0198316682 /NCGR_PEP_ID=MMETSP1450-20131203/6479_1 /TAXON_ID=753684 ORGANISM="Madagascaria erythrocladiodes, Strain CCMP3234" /NCGR_SAMPLE_ID=MMETSP1450 /ASSEMBLY_ACC=CAM_ASM_001115 /LENGTH=424 /DNA_ID=CAMNT_0044019849 /DNA_START=246 /DNA_END=1520 /DNA_ORIENTATION=+